VIVKAVKL